MGSGYRYAEELKGLGVDAGYDAYRIKIGGEIQFGGDFVAINPNSKFQLCWINQAIKPFVSLNRPISSLYLGEKFGKLIPTDPG